MGRFFKKIFSGVREALSDKDGARNEFEDKKPDALRNEIRMISGCEDSQTSADVSNVSGSGFSLPDPAGRAGGACTSTLLSVLYADEQVPEDDLSFTQVLNAMRVNLAEQGFTQIPQLTSSNPIDVNADFDLVPANATGTRRAVMIGINYVGDDPGELRGCHNDVLNMKKYIMHVHGFEEDNITILMDDGEHDSPTKENILEAYKKVIEETEESDAIFLHYSGHGTKVKDRDGDEADGYDEALVPVDYQEEGLINDDDLYDILCKPLAKGATMVSLMDCCHSGTILDLPYIFKADGSMPEGMQLDESLDFDGLIQSFGGHVIGFLTNFLK
eukprot:CAMPEP_0194147066 /NCGR_PEP_ID=MMETSP0152-20130528/22502_1 /TAXON_ID=1049557 /ORGANISM="Thalassiothrix antarctica, Strain L6-D1" /LENGTH=329 /DNA_ID=CAMNT_0038847753 /DNA_START=90 /DNA_END=1079 /DNA_ORIENTATION=+